jgi:hypothetical protein
MRRRGGVFGVDPDGRYVIGRYTDISLADPTGLVTLANHIPSRNDPAVTFMYAPFAEMVETHDLKVC